MRSDALLHCFGYALAALLSIVAVASEPISLAVGENGTFVDQHQRVRIFHGVNVVYKLFPYVPSTDAFDPFDSFSEEDARLLWSNGMNLIRLAVMWPGVEPQRSVRNQSYIEQIRKIVTLSAAYNISVILEFHQDLLSEAYCGEGIPQWATYTDRSMHFPFPLGWQDVIPLQLNLGDDHTPPFALGSDGRPSRSDCDRFYWSQFTYSALVAAGYQQFYTNWNGTRDAFVNHWKFVASSFLQHENVLGYEIMNEPFPGDFWKNFELVLPTPTTSQLPDRALIAPFMDVVARAIYSVDPSRVVFWTGNVVTDVAPVGFDEVPGGKTRASHSALVYHYYSTNHPNLEPFVDQRIQDSRRLGCASILTEFDLGAPERAQVMDLMDKQHQSWAAWQYKRYAPITGWSWGFFNEDGSQNLSVQRALARIYPEAVSGILVSYAYDPDSRTFEMSFWASPEIAMPTRIRVPPSQYAGRFQVAASAAASPTQDGLHHELSEWGVQIWYSGQTVQLVQVIVTPE
ncbi:glycoside hydrolase superfamily [Polychytrium aggregatum]|uniref:glycoside hydrolase superfamily n=1 Tax=Polychytrium aggregatum TaxID=110093 RepID=UPI0022FEFEB2|nr:glycoside hydrolase superfamily [Polychytrium aggregatum]KAI9203944.1 glycoside hydrolase superfamily [Polychytrium aggregatum]